MTARKAAASSGSQSWDQFWGAVSGGRTEVIRNVEVTVPTDIPLILEQRITELQDSQREEDVAELVEMLFGQDCMAQWREAGMGLREFQTLLTWGISHASGKEISFHEAYDLVQNGEGAGSGKAPTPNRAARRAQSAGTGGRSKRTSSASTGSARTRSRT